MKQLAKKKFITLKAFLEDKPDLLEIVNLFRLSPDYLNWRVWYDSWNYQIIFDNHSTTSVSKNNSSSYDLMKFSSFERVFNSSVMMNVLIEDKIYILLIGKDDLGRIFVLNDCELINSSPLSIGIPRLRKLIGKYKEENTFVRMFPLPLSNNDLNELGDKNKIIFDKIIKFSA